ncbi:YdcH family protein [Brevundimonas sp.]|uniref:YdcH family protein n=1 Tax=Brevundimonas sp. TaxID=1871086 RepID=UPI002EDA0BEC
MNDDQPFLSDDDKLLRAELNTLQQEHADLDASIDALGLVPIPDQLLIARLKRKKLALRDEIVKIEDRILPDIIA